VTVFSARWMSTACRVGPPVSAVRHTTNHVSDRDIRGFLSGTTEKSGDLEFQAVSVAIICNLKALSVLKLLNVSD
jgi:hypothetical protein